MSSYLETQYDKFTFRVADERYYSPDGIWISLEGGRARLGVSDFLQQRSGDVAFVEVAPAGTTIKREDELASIETIKVNLSLPSPLGGKVLEVNPIINDSPELINQDPYGTGWLLVLQPDDWEASQRDLLDARAYLEEIKRRIEKEA